MKSHLEVVAPLLQSHGFGATFFITQAWMNDREHFLSWEEAAQLHKMGFEIGNHSWTHPQFSTPRLAVQLAGELALVENQLARVGVPKPVSFAWTGNGFGPESVRVLESAGYKLARRGMQPEAPYGSLELGPLFNPQRHHPLLMPTAGDSYPNWTLDHFKKVVDRATEGQAVILQFHGVPDVKHPWVHTPVENFRSYLDYLKQGGFRVLALRDLLPFLPDSPVTHDPMAATRYPAGSTEAPYWPVETDQTRAQLDFWLSNMAHDHGYTLSEIRTVTALPTQFLTERLAQLVPLDKPLEHQKNPPGLKLRPYPGGRHPRIGFLDGAIEPLRGTKVSIFPPWEDGGYLVLDLPEAIFSNLGLAFLAHTHIPTIWNAQNRVIENRDWIVAPDGALRSEWTLPNGIQFGASLRARGDGAALELWLHNGTKEKLTGLRTQVCLMLKAVHGFNAQNQERKTYQEPLVVAQDREGKRALLLAFERSGRAWGNEQCPCLHSDPVLPDAAPGERVAVRGHLLCYQGDDLAGAKKRLLAEIGLTESPSKSGR